MFTDCEFGLEILTYIIIIVQIDYGIATCQSKTKWLSPNVFITLPEQLYNMHSINAGNREYSNLAH